MHHKTPVLQFREGPIQSDLFPILEHTAPKAFFGEFTRLNIFDERTRQQLLAPEWKRRVLSSLPLDEVRMVLSAYTSVNGELYARVFGQPSTVTVPCIFQTPPPAPPPPGAGATAVDQASLAFAAGDLMQAEQYIALALQMKPGDPMAEYVRRVVEREKQRRSVQVSDAR